MSLIGRDHVVDKRASARRSIGQEHAGTGFADRTFRNVTDVFQRDEGSRTISGRMSKKGQMRFGAGDGD
jgi:hypothetical protein